MRRDRLSSLAPDIAQPVLPVHGAVVASGGLAAEAAESLPPRGKFARVIPSLPLELVPYGLVTGEESPRLRTHQRERFVPWP